MKKLLMLILALLFVTSTIYAGWSVTTNGASLYRGAYSSVFQATNSMSGKLSFSTNYNFSRGFLKYKRVPLMYWTSVVTNTGAISKLNIISVNGTNVKLQVITSRTDANSGIFRLYFMLPNSSIK